MKNRRQAFAVLSWTAAGCWMLFLFLLSCLNGRTARRLVGRDFGDGVERAGGHAGPGLPRTGRWIELLTPATLQFLAYMLLAVLCWNAFRLCGLGINSAPAMGLAVTTLFAVTDELHQIFTPGRMPRIPDFLVSFAGALLVLGGIRLFQFAWKTYPRVVNRETVSYVVFGVLTTIINIVTYLLCSTAFTAARAMNEVVINLVSQCHRLGGSGYFRLCGQQAVCIPKPGGHPPGGGEGVRAVYRRTAAVSGGGCRGHGADGERRPTQQGIFQDRHERGGDGDELFLQQMDHFHREKGKRAFSAGEGTE